MASRPILRSLGLWLTAVVLSACPGDSTGATETDDETTDAETDTSDTDPDTSDTAPDTTTTNADTTTTNADTTTTDDPTEDTTAVDPTEGECGNGVIDDGEECDGDELDGSTCVDQGFTDGRLACADDCTFDTSACTDPKPGCGDGIVDEGEDCDGEDLAGEDCVTQGFDQGELACAKDCTFDLSACETLCGNGVIDDGEACDGEALNGEDCVSQGFAAGTLGCAADCSAFDIDACFDEDCSNGLDDNGDKLVDCDDPICAADLACNGPIELIVGCDPQFCTLTAGGGPNGGDLCSCTIPAARQPVSDDVADASCFIGDPAPELLFAFEPVAAFSVSTCVTTPGDSAVAAYGADPTPGGVNELGCNEDASPITPPYCSELGDNAVGEALPVATLGAAELWISVDEYDPAEYWDGVTDRVIDIELIAEGVPEVCADGLDNDFDGTTDCADDECADSIGCAPIEVLVGCDPGVCTLADGAGANGGDLCTCVIPGGAHPLSDDIAEASCFGGGSNGRDLVVSFATAGYTSYVATTCLPTSGDSSMASFDGDPDAGGAELECSEDASGDFSYCSEIADNGGAGGGLPSPVPNTGMLWLTIDEWNLGNYWNGATSRQFSVELIP